MMTIQYKFVDIIPDEVPFGTIFISIKYKTAIHKCVCGCGNEVVTPISPTDWQLTFDGQSVSLNPSIGNWNFDCKSHYWIEKTRFIIPINGTRKKLKREGRKMCLKRKGSLQKEKIRTRIYEALLLSTRDQKCIFSKPEAVFRFSR